MASETSKGYANWPPPTHLKITQAVTLLSCCPTSRAKTQISSCLPGGHQKIHNKNCMQQIRWSAGCKKYYQVVPACYSLLVIDKCEKRRRGLCKPNGQWRRSTPLQLLNTLAYVNHKVLGLGLAGFQNECTFYVHKSTNECKDLKVGGKIKKAI